MSARSVKVLLSVHARAALQAQDGDFRKADAGPKAVYLPGPLIEEILQWGRGYNERLAKAPQKDLGGGLTWNQLDKIYRRLVAACEPLGAMPAGNYLVRVGQKGVIEGGAKLTDAEAEQVLTDEEAMRAVTEVLKR